LTIWSHSKKGDNLFGINRHN